MEICGIFMVTHIPVTYRLNIIKPKRILCNSFFSVICVFTSILCNVSSYRILDFITIKYFVPEVDFSSNPMVCLCDEKALHLWYYG